MRRQRPSRLCLPKGSPSSKPPSEKDLELNSENGNLQLQSTNFNRYGDQLLYQPTVEDVTNQLNLGSDKSLTPKAPVFAYHALYDE